MFQMGGVGPMLGQAHHFRLYAPEKIPYAIDRYSNEAKRLYGVIDKRLGQSRYIAADEYTIADIAIFPWLRSWKNQGIELDDYPAPQGLVRRHRRAPGGAARRRGAGRAAQARSAPTRSARCCSARRSTSVAESACRRHARLVLERPLRTIAPVRGVAQPGSATGLGPVGREFESRRPDQRRFPSGRPSCP